MRAFLREALMPNRLAATFLCVSLGATILQLRPTLISTAKKSEATIDMAGRAMTNLDAASKSLKTAADNETKFIPQFSERINGAIDNANSALLGVRGAVGSVGTLAQQATATIDAATADLEALKAPIDGLSPIEAQITETIPEIKLAFVNLNALATDADVKKAIANVQGMTHSGNSILGDAADETHKLVHPDKKKLTFWGAIEAGTLWWHSHNPLPPMF